MNAPVSEAVNTVADALVAARTSGHPTPAAPWTGLVADARAASQVQAAVARRLGWFSGFPVYWKCGAPNRATPAGQTPLPPAGVMEGPARIADLGLRLRLVEAEIALRLAREVSVDEARALLDRQRSAPDAAATQAAIDALIDASAVSLEFVDARWSEGLDVPKPLMLADQHGHGALVLGAWQPYRRRDWTAEALAVTLSSAGNGNGTHRHVGTHPVGDPAWLLPQWLAALAAAGSAVPAGTVVTTGSWNGMQPVPEGATLTVVFDGYAPVQIA